MTDAPWLTIVGLTEDGPAGLTPASLKALRSAKTIMGAERHLSLLGALKAELDAEVVAWPVPFADGLAVLEELRGTTTVALASGDPFWFGAGSVIAKHFEPDEWCALPNTSVFSHAAAHLGWPLETTHCIGLHAAPFANARKALAPGQRMIITLRDGAAVGDFASWLEKVGFGASTLHILEALGGPGQRVRMSLARDFAFEDVAHPVAVAVDVAGDGALPLASGKPDVLFENDGQITKRPIRALTLSALAPRHGERLWDLGAGSGSIALEWLMSDPSLKAIAVEARPERVENIRQNALALGQERLEIVTGNALDHIADLPLPDTVFVGGGLTSDLLATLWDICPSGTRIVANAVTLETEALVVAAQAQHGGDLMRIALSYPKGIGRYRAWDAAYPLVQWSVVR